MHTIASHHSSAIIFVDSEQSVLVLLHRLLRDLADGYDLLPATTSAAALAQLARRPVALVIIDAQPDMQIVALIQAIKAQVPACPVLLLTRPGRQVECGIYEAGVDFCLSMPFPFALFGSVVRTALSLSVPASYA